MARARVQKRHQLIYYLKVYDVESDAFLGNLVDITTRGIRLISEKPIPINRKYILKLQLPEGHFRETEIHFEGKSLWSDQDVNPDYVATGFEVTGLSLEERKIIRQLIDKIGFHG